MAKVGHHTAAINIIPSARSKQGLLKYHISLLLILNIHRYPKFVRLVSNEWKIKKKK